MARLSRATITLRRALAADAETQRAMLDRMAGHKPAKRRAVPPDPKLARVMAWLEVNPIIVEGLIKGLDARRAHEREGR